MSNNIHFVKGNGIHLYTPQNEEYIDAVSGTFNIALGYSHPELVDTLNTGRRPDPRFIFFLR